jgi:hypothetical protein
MTPAPSATRRLSTLGCVLLGGAALLLPGCGDGGGATAESTATSPPPGQKAKAAATTGRTCPAQIDSFRRSLDALRRQLAIGLSYEQYATKVKAVRRSYDQLPIDRLTIRCLTATGTRAEQAFNKYIDAANAWGECLADASCTTATIEPVLQRKWRLASNSLEEAQ